MCDAAVAESRATGSVSDDDRVLRPAHLDIVERDRLHQFGGIDTLLVTRPDQVVECHAGQRDNGRAVHIGVVESVEQMYRAGACGADADPQASSMFGEARSHEGCGLLMPNADILDAVPPLTERLDDGVDAVPDDAERVRGSPGNQRIHD